MKYKSGEDNRRNDVGEQAGKYVATIRHAMSDQSYATPEASLRLPFDQELFGRSRDLARKLAGPKLAYILHIGIGGSNLGARALYEATAGVLDAHMPIAPKMLFADTCAPELLADLTELLLNEIKEKEEIIVIVASKSGTTTETIVNASILIPALEQKLGPLSERVVCITDQGSALWSVGEEHDYSLLPVPKNVGGRFSVFSPTGMFPLLCMGVDGEALLRGATAVVTECVEKGVDSDAYLLAQDIYSWHDRGTTLFDLFMFHPELEALGKWYRQLFAESLGKSSTKDGGMTTHKIVPSVSIGSTDLHSAEQMYMANPSLAARILVRAHIPHWEHQFIAEDKIFSPLAPAAQRRAPCEIMDAIYDGVVGSYRERGVHFGEIVLNDLDPESLGAMLQLLMCATMHLANFLNINAFDQPDVEAYKIVMKRALGGNTE